MRKPAILLIGAFLAFLPGSCKTSSEAPGKTSPLELPGAAINPLNLQADLINFSRRFSAEVSGTASTIAARTQDRKAREMTIEWKLATIVPMNLLVLDPDPRKGYSDACLLCVRQRVVLEGALGDIFGDQKALAVETTRELEQALVEIGIRHFGKETLAAAAKKFEAYAKEHTFREGAVGQAFGVVPQDGSATTGDMMMGFFRLPLAPLSGLRGVGDTPGAINNFTLTARALGEMLQAMPERIRWQMELFLFEVDSIDTLVQVREGIERTSKSIESLARTGESLPAVVRKELDASLESVAAAQDKIRPTIEATQKGLATADQAAQSIGRSAAELEKTAAAWESTVRAINDLLKTYQEIAPAKKEAPAGAVEPGKPAAAAPEEQKGTTPQDITNIAVEIRAAAVELRGLLNDLGTGKLTTAVARVGETSTASIDHATGRVEKLIVWATVGGLILIAATLGAFFIYRRTAVR